MCVCITDHFAVFQYISSIFQDKIKIKPYTLKKRRALKAFSFP